MDNEEIVEAARRGSRQAFDDIVGVVEPAIARYDINRGQVLAGKGVVCGFSEDGSPPPVFLIPTQSSQAACS